VVAAGAWALYSVIGTRAESAGSRSGQRARAGLRIVQSVNGPFGEVSALPVVVPLGLVLFALLLWRLHARRLLSLPRSAVAGALAVYAAGVMANTVFPIFLRAPDRGPWSPGLALIPFYDYEVADAVMNTLVFLPLGMLIPLLLSRPTWWRVLAVAVAVSLTIEVTQLAAQGLFGGGHIADVNDVLFNIAGGALGYALFRFLRRVPGFAGFIDRFRWVGTSDHNTTAAHSGPVR
jgi:glycopeptide antibiotics resistance protein